MSHTDEITYRVPVSCIRVSGTVTEVDDALLRTHLRTPAATISLEVLGGERLTAKVDSSWLNDTSVTVAMTDDGVLTSSSVASTGEAGKAVVGAVSLGATVAGAFVGSPAVVGAAAAAAHASGADKAVRNLVAEPPKRQHDPVLAEFAKQQPDVYRMRVRYAALVEELQGDVADALDAMSKSSDEPQPKNALDLLKSSTRALAAARVEADRLDAVFDAWRATTIKTRTEEWDVLISVDEVRWSGVSVGSDNKLTIPGDGDDANTPEGRARAKVGAIWATLGVAVTVEQEPVSDIEEGDDTDFDNPANQSSQEAQQENHIVVRFPRRVTLKLYKRAEEGGDAAAVLVSSKSHLVMDQRCKLQSLPFSKSIWGKRTEAFTFSTLGALTGLSTTRTAAAAALADAAKAIPGAVSGGLEQSKKIYDDMQALHGRTADLRLAELKKEIALKQSEISLAGLHATEAQAAELERLKQQEAILKEQKAIAGYS